MAAKGDFSSAPDQPPPSMAYEDRVSNRVEYKARKRKTFSAASITAVSAPSRRWHYDTPAPAKIALVGWCRKPGKRRGTTPSIIFAKAS